MQPRQVPSLETVHACRNHNRESNVLQRIVRLKTSLLLDSTILQARLGLSISSNIARFRRGLGYCFVDYCYSPMKVDLPEGLWMGMG